MKMTRLSVHRALMELKTLDKRIERATKATFVGYKVGEEGTPSNYKSVQEFIDTVKNNHQSVRDLIKRRNAIKAAIIKSNAETSVEIAGVPMTIAEAIDRKAAISYEKALLAQFEHQYRTVQFKVQTEEQVMQQRIDKRVEDITGKDKKADVSEQEDIEKMVKRRYQPEIIDPLELRTYIEKFKQEIEDFELEVDPVLSESNGHTFIEVE